MALAASFALSVGLVPSAAAAPAPFEPAPCPFTPPTGLEDGRNLHCGFLTVPEQRTADAPPGRAPIRLGVVIVSARHPAGKEPVVYLSGGPGAAASAHLPLLFDPASPIQPLLEDHDWILLDQRGTGFSQPLLACPEAPLSGPVLDDVDQITPAWVCGGRLTDAGVELAAFNTAENAGDVADLIEALGYEQATLYGVSYGTRLALRVMRDYPDQIRAAVLDGVYPPQASGQANIPASFSRSLRAVFEACANDSACNARHPDLGRTFDHLLMQLDEQPPPVQYTDPSSSTTSTIPLNGKSFLALLFTLLYQKDGIQLVPALIGLTAEGDYRAVESLLPNLGAYGVGVGEGAFYAIECTDEGQRPPSPTTDLEPLPRVADDMAYADQLVTICAEFPSSPSQPTDAAAVSSEISTLLLVGAYDPVTPPEYAQLASETLSRATIVQFSDQGHGALTSGACAVGIIAQFLAQPERAPSAGCAEQGTLEFVLPQPGN